MTACKHAWKEGATNDPPEGRQFNVENLFERAKVFTFWDPSIGDDILEKVDQLRGILAEDNYTELRKQRILQLYSELKDYIEVREDRGKLFKRSGWAVVGMEANGQRDWDGTIEFKPAEFSEVARQNTAQVIKDVNPHIMCVVEAESRPTMQAFDAHLLNYRFRYEMLIDANDPRGIDVGLYSKYPLGSIQTHMFDKVVEPLIHASHGRRGSPRGPARQDRRR